LNYRRHAIRLHKTVYTVSAVSYSSPVQLMPSPVYSWLHSHL